MGEFCYAQMRKRRDLLSRYNHDFCVGTIFSQRKYQKELHAYGNNITAQAALDFSTRSWYLNGIQLLSSILNLHGSFWSHSRQSGSWAGFEDFADLQNGIVWEHGIRDIHFNSIARYFSSDLEGWSKMNATRKTFCAESVTVSCLIGAANGTWTWGIVCKGAKTS